MLENYKLSPVGIVSLMDLPLSKVWANRLEFLNSCDSTNLELMRRLDADPELPTFTVLAAGEQTGGRGRLDRGWVSEPGGSLSVSILIRSEGAAELQWLTPAAAMAVADTVAELLGLHPDESPAQASIEIKWPNDVLVRGRKISGILAQMHPSGNVVVGIGLNLQPQSGAPETAIALAELGVDDLDYDQLLANLLARFRAKAHLVMSGASDLVAREYRGRLGTIGKKVRLILPTEEISGVAMEVDRDGRIGIRVDGASQELRWFAAGDVVHLRN